MFTNSILLYIMSLISEGEIFTMDKFNFGNRLKQLRKSYGITQAQLAENLNERRATLSNYENKNVYPGFNMLIKLADYFHVSVGYVSTFFVISESETLKRNIKKSLAKWKF